MKEASICFIVKVKINQLLSSLTRTTNFTLTNRLGDTCAPCTLHHIVNCILIRDHAWALLEAAGQANGDWGGKWPHSIEVLETAVLACFKHLKLSYSSNWFLLQGNESSKVKSRLQNSVEVASLQSIRTRVPGNTHCVDCDTPSKCQFSCCKYGYNKYYFVVKRYPPSLR